MHEFKVSAYINGVQERFIIRAGEYHLPSDIKAMIKGYAQERYGKDATVGKCSWKVN